MKILVIRVSMNRLHVTVDNSKSIVNGFQHRHNRIGSARRRSNQLVIRFDLCEFTPETMFFISPFPEVVSNILLTPLLVRCRPRPSMSLHAPVLSTMSASWMPYTV